MSWPIAGRSSLGTLRIPRIISVSSPERPRTRTRTASIWSSVALSDSSDIARWRMVSSSSRIKLSPIRDRWISTAARAARAALTRETKRSRRFVPRPLPFCGFASSAAGEGYKQKTMWHRPHGCIGARRKERNLRGFFQAERVLRDAHQLGKQAVALQRQQREHLAIDLDAGLGQPIDEAAIRHAELARERIDPRDP